MRLPIQHFSLMTLPIDSFLPTTILLFAVFLDATCHAFTKNDSTSAQHPQILSTASHDRIGLK
ncbi:MAG: hypothetical protein SPI30_04130 [Prevotella sp.]|nr:hypothetical protein [Prevotella sp.]